MSGKLPGQEVRSPEELWTRLRLKNLKKGGHFPATVDRGENGFGDFLADDQIFDGRRGETR